MSTSQREHHTQQRSWQKGDKRAGNYIHFFCLTGLLTQLYCSKPEEMWQAVWQQLPASYFMFMALSNPLEIPQSAFQMSHLSYSEAVFRIRVVASWATQRLSSKTTARTHWLHSGIDGVTACSALLSFHCSLRGPFGCRRQRKALSSFSWLTGIVTQMSELLLNPKEKGKMDLYLEKVTT